MSFGEKDRLQRLQFGHQKQWTRLAEVVGEM